MVVACSSRSGKAAAVRIVMFTFTCTAFEHEHNSQITRKNFTVNPVKSAAVSQLQFCYQSLMRPKYDIVFLSVWSR